VCKKLVAENGLKSLNIRSVAEKCNVSVGSVYNYFPSKADLISDTIREIWQSIFQTDLVCEQTESFPAYVALIFENFQSGSAEFPHFFAEHSMSFATVDKGKGRKVMERYFEQVKSKMLDALDYDSNVAIMTFTKDFTKSDFVNFVFSNLLMLLTNQEKSCSKLIEVIKRTIYK
jgi:AcrR family transcriptional regulator